jgi:hypothetical protein
MRNGLSAANGVCNWSKFMSELEKLKTQNAELADRIAKLEEAAKPPKPFKSEWRGPIDYTQGMSMGRSAMQAMIDARFRLD